MFERIKRAMLAGTVVAIGGLAGPAMASAAYPSWSPAGAADGVGQLTWALGAMQFTCDVDFTLSLVNDGTMHGGDISSFSFSNCFSNDPRCLLSLVADVSPPWTTTKFTSDPARVGINGINFSFVYSGATCPLNGVNLIFDGNIAGDYDGSTGELWFDAEPGLTTPLGNPTVTGSVFLTAEATGDPIDLV